MSPQQRMQPSIVLKEELLGASTALLCLSVTHPTIPAWDNGVSKTVWEPWSEKAQPCSAFPFRLFPGQVCCRSLPLGAPTRIIIGSHSKTCATTAEDLIVWFYWHSNPITVHLRVFYTVISQGFDLMAIRCALLQRADCSSASRPAPRRNGEALKVLLCVQGTWQSLPHPTLGSNVLIKRWS